MKTKIKEINYPHQGDYMLPRVFYVPMIKPYLLLPWMILEYDPEYGFNLTLWPSKSHEVFITATDAQELIDKYIDEKTYGRPYIKVIEYANGRIAYCPMVDIDKNRYSIHKLPNKNEYYLDKKYKDEYKTELEASNIIRTYLYQKKDRTVVSTSESPYIK